MRRLEQSPAGLPDKAFLAKVCSDRWILHAPKRHLIVGTIDPVIEDREKEARCISRAEIDQLFSRNLKLAAQWNAASASELSQLGQLVRTAAGDETAVPADYMCETTWSTLEQDVDDAAVSYNLKIV